MGLRLVSPPFLSGEPAVLKHYDREVQRIRQHVASQTDHIQHNLRVVLGFDTTGGDFIDDKILDANEVLIEEDCLKIIALHQPVADNLRYLVTVIKANYDLERIGDMLESIHKLKLDPQAVDRDVGEGPDFLSPLFHLVLRAVEEALVCLRSPDPEQAREIWRNDQQVDGQAKRNVATIRQRLLDAPATPTLLDALYAVRSAERIADNAANIAKEILYLCTGEIVRHRKKQILGAEGQGA